VSKIEEDGYGFQRRDAALPPVPPKVAPKVSPTALPYDMPVPFEPVSPPKGSDKLPSGDPLQPGTVIEHAPKPTPGTGATYYRMLGSMVDLDDPRCPVNVRRWFADANEGLPKGLYRDRDGVVRSDYRR
jgi:hypothetical protein